MECAQERPLHASRHSLVFVLLALLLRSDQGHNATHDKRARIARMVDTMWKESVSKGADLIRQGDLVANTFYVVQAGEFDVILGGSAGGEAQVVASQPKGSSFGELALLYLTPRAATVRAKVDSEVRVARNREGGSLSEWLVETWASSCDLKPLLTTPSVALPGPFH